MGSPLLYAMTKYARLCEQIEGRALRRIANSLRLDQTVCVCR